MDDLGGQLRGGVDLLAERLLAASTWVGARPESAHLPLGYFGASTGAAAALEAAAERPDLVSAVVSRGGRPDLASSLAKVRAATLLIVAMMLATPWLTGAIALNPPSARSRQRPGRSGPVSLIRTTTDFWSAVFVTRTRALNGNVPAIAVCRAAVRAFRLNVSPFAVFRPSKPAP